MARKKKSPAGQGRQSTMEALRAKKGAVVTVYVALRLMVIAVLVAQVFKRNFENVFLCGLTLLLLLVPTFVERKIHVDLPDTLEELRRL